VHLDVDSGLILRVLGLAFGHRGLDLSLVDYQSYEPRNIMLDGHSGVARTGNNGKEKKRSPM